MHSKGRSSISDKNWAAKKRSDINVKCIPDFEDLVWKKKKEKAKCKMSQYCLYWLLVEMIKFGIY